MSLEYINTNEKIDMLVKAPHFYTLADEGLGYRSGVTMVIKCGRIEGFIPERYADKYDVEEVLELNHHVIFPGLIDGHMHTPINVLRGLAQDTRHWMEYGIEPFARVMPAEAMISGSKVGIIEAIKCGTTTLGDYDTDMDSVCSFIELVGARGNITQTIQGYKQKLYKPGQLYELDDKMAEDMLQRNIRLYDKWNGKADGRIRVLFGPKGPDFLSRDMLLRIKEIATEKNTLLCMHVQQGDRELWQMGKRYGKRSVEFLNEIGYLDSRLISIHLTECTDEEAAMVADSGSTMVVNPGSIGIIDGLVCPSVAFQEAGGVCGLGSDQAPGSNCHNIINEMKNVALFNKIKYRNPEIMPAWKALRMATIEGAKAIGLDGITGSLEPGKAADFIAVDLNNPSMLPVYTYPMRNIVPNLVYSARGHEVTHSVVNGIVVMRDRKLTRVNEEAILEDISKYPEIIGNKAAGDFFRINGNNAKFMKEERL